MRTFLSLLIILFFTSFAQAQNPPTGIQDEGGSISRPVYVIDCTGSGISCSHSGITGTLNVSGGGGGGGASLTTQIDANTESTSTGTYNFVGTNFKIQEKQKGKSVLFLGRITLQKGPDYFLQAAKKVIEMDDEISFIIAGDGDMRPFVIEKAAELGISDKITFAGFLRGEYIDRAYQMADLYVIVVF